MNRPASVSCPPNSQPEKLIIGAVAANAVAVIHKGAYSQLRSLRTSPRRYPAAWRTGWNKKGIDSFAMRLGVDDWIQRAKQPGTQSSQPMVNTKNFAVGVNALPFFPGYQFLYCMKKAAIFRRPSDCQPARYYPAICAICSASISKFEYTFCVSSKSSSTSSSRSIWFAAGPSSLV